MESVQQLSIFVALGAGLLSFISPCVLPLFPAYLSFITGMSATEMHHTATVRRQRSRIMLHALCFIAGFSLIFVALGASFSLLGSFLRVHLDLIQRIGGVVAEIDKIEQDMHFFAPGKGGRAFIVNEAHGLRTAIIRRLLGLLERIPNHVCIIFTTTKQGESKLFDDQIDANPLLSRCAKIELTNQGLAKVFAEHCREIATREDLNGKPIASYVRLAQNCKNNCRQMLMTIESGEMLE